METQHGSYAISTGVPTAIAVPSRLLEKRRPEAPSFLSHKKGTLPYIPPPPSVHHKEEGDFLPPPSGKRLPFTLSGRPIPYFLLTPSLFDAPTSSLTSFVPYLGRRLPWRPSFRRSRPSRFPFDGCRPACRCVLRVTT